jgi:hypothetical protein
MGVVNEDGEVQGVERVEGSKYSTFTKERRARYIHHHGVWMQRCSEFAAHNRACVDREWKLALGICVLRREAVGLSSAHDIDS